MTTYLVQRRMQEDRTYLPGEVLVDPENINVDLLHRRGYLVIVPDSYEGAKSGESIQDSTETSASSETSGDESDQTSSPASGESEGGTASSGDEPTATDQPSGPTGLNTPVDENQPPNGEEPVMSIGAAGSAEPPKIIDLEAEAKEAESGKEKDKEAK